jgi:hypothetical protein
MSTIVVAKPQFIEVVARSIEGGMHTQGARHGSINITRVASELNVSRSALAAAYDGRPVSFAFIAALIRWFGTVPLRAALDIRESEVSHADT